MTGRPALPTDVGVLLTDMGGPASTEDIEAFLRALLGDPRILRMPFGFLLRPILARRIARTRTPMVAPRYAAIGGGSPLLEATLQLAAAVEGLLGNPVRVAMRYTAPRLAAALEDLGGSGLERVVVIPLYPQYSTSTTASTLDDLRRNAPSQPAVTVVDRHADRPGYLDVLSGLLAVTRAAAAEGAHVLFTAHSVPESFTRAGDPYVSEIEATVTGIAIRAGLEPRGHSLAFQSVGPVGRWHGPAVGTALERLHGDGVRDLVVQPLSFVSENLETLWDLDIEMRRRCDTLGMSVRRVPAPGTSPGYVALLADLASEAAEREGWL
ncbi:MAG: ferrochelatase [Pseudomonadota bacterium]